MNQPTEQKFAPSYDDLTTSDWGHEPLTHDRLDAILRKCELASKYPMRLVDLSELSIVDQSGGLLYYPHSFHVPVIRLTVP